MEFENQETVLNENKIDEEIVEKPISVYVKVDENGFITWVDSEIFIKDLTGWQKIDEGFGDKYAHAQTQYFENPIIDENGNARYKINNI